MHFIAVGVLAFSILFSNASYTQDLTKTDSSVTRTTQEEQTKLEKKAQKDLEAQEKKAQKDLEAQEKKAQKDLEAQEKRREQEVVFTSLSGAKPFSFATFSPYRAQKIANTGIIEWKDRYQKPQTKYNVSLIGVNVNSWLENPEYLNVLNVQGENFSISGLLDNLQSYNPNLVFNDPEVVKKALNNDIYSPYLKNISNYTDKNVRFSDVNRVISYTRRYHIYGVGAGGLPYFGRPMEGGKREINLGVLPGQIDEVAVKLPETDIFLVAMINIVPNWLEEGMNILQKNQQELEIMIYAFDRKGKLLGGAGIPMDFVHKGHYFVMEQKIRSKIWQEGVSRQFYMWASFRILNDKDKNQERVAPNITLPQDTWPTLNKKQKYILASIKDLRANKKDLNVELFTPKGDSVFNPKKIKETNKVTLANRIILHRDSKLLVRHQKINRSDLVTYNIMGRFEDMSDKKALEKKEKDDKKALEKKEKDDKKALEKKEKDDKKALEKKEKDDKKALEKKEKDDKKALEKKEKDDKKALEKKEKDDKKALKKKEKDDKKIGTSEKTILTQKHYPSNEGVKLASLLQYGKEMLVKAPISHTNEVHYTNEVIAYELEVDPVIYAKERKKYVSLSHSLKEFVKIHKKNTKTILKEEKLKTKDKIFWNEFTVKRLDAQGITTQEIEDALKNWKKLYSSLEKVEYEMHKMDRQALIYTDQEKAFSQLKNRNVQFLNEKYEQKTNTLSKKISKLDIRANKLLDKIVLKQKNEKNIERRNLLQQEYDVLLKQEQEAFKTMTALFPTSVNYMKILKKDKETFVDITEVVLANGEDVKVIAELNNVNPELVAVARSVKNYSPMQKYNDKNKKKLLKTQRKKEKNLTFEGFSLGLTRAWKTKTTLSDRLDYL